MPGSLCVCVCVPASPGCRCHRPRSALPQPRGRTGGAQRAGPPTGGRCRCRGRSSPPDSRPPVGSVLPDTPSPRERPPAAAFAASPKGKFEHPSARLPAPQLFPQCLTRGAAAAALVFTAPYKPRPTAPFSSFPSIIDSPPVFSAAEVTFP